MSTRQAKSIRVIRAERRANKQCVACGEPSPKYRCEKCRPAKSAAEKVPAKKLSAIRRAAVRARWKNNP